MAIMLKENERLVYAGTVALRAPNGEPLPAVARYMIVPVDEADPACVVELKDNERLVLGGQIFTDRKRAEERFAALKAGREQPPREVGTPLYFIENAANINPKTECTYESDKIIETMSKELAEIYALHIRRKQALARVNRQKENVPDYAGDLEKSED